MSQLEKQKPNVAVIREENQYNCISKGLDLLGGIKKFVKPKDHVFVKFNLRLPNGFPVNTSFETLKAIISFCDEAGAEKIQLGSFPNNGFTIKKISELLGMKDFFASLGAELVFLDNSKYFTSKKPDAELLEGVKKRTLTSIQKDSGEVFYPNPVLEATKLISVNQVNIDPIFQFTSSILNSYSLIPPYNQKIDEIIQPDGTPEEDDYKEKIINRILDVFSIKVPDLIINDLFHLLEGAGPIIYKDSVLKQMGLMILGDNAVSVDFLTIKTLKFEQQKNGILNKAIKRGYGPAEFLKINLSGERVEEVATDIKKCHDKLEDINLMKFNLKQGNLCSGCFQQAYHLLNLIKTIMTKDLKYISSNNFLIGDQPSNMDCSGDCILFGDCAINSTEKLSFRTIRTEKTTKKGKKKVKIKQNKNIMQLPGCPPNIDDCIHALIDFYGKSKFPSLNLYNELMSTYAKEELEKTLKIWEGL